MAIPEGWISYTATVRNKIGKQASKKVEDMIASYIATNPNATGEELRSFAFNAIRGVLQTQGEAAGALARDNFATVMDSAGENVDAKLYGYDDIIDEDYMRGHIYKSYRNNFSDSAANIEQFIRAMGDTASSGVNRMHMMNTKLNADANDKRYARVPTGSKTCAWCMMLASRGAMYYSEDTAKAGNHNNCDCVFVAMPKGKYVDGWDGKSWERMQETMEICGIDPYTQFDELTKEQMARLNDYLSFQSVLYYKNGAIVPVKYIKPRDLLTVDEKEAVDALQKAGFAICTLKEDPTASVNIDSLSLINNALIEFKNVSNLGSSLNNQFKRMRAKQSKIETIDDSSQVFGLITTNGMDEASENITIAVMHEMRKNQKVFIVSQGRIHAYLRR